MTVMFSECFIDIVPIISLCDISNSCYNCKVIIIKFRPYSTAFRQIILIRLSVKLNQTNVLIWIFLRSKGVNLFNIIKEEWKHGQKTWGTDSINRIVKQSQISKFLYESLVLVNWNQFRWITVLISKLRVGEKKTPRAPTTERSSEIAIRPQKLQQSEVKCEDFTSLICELLGGKLLMPYSTAGCFHCRNCLWGPSTFWETYELLLHLELWTKSIPVWELQVFAGKKVPAPREVCCHSWATVRAMFATFIWFNFCTFCKASFTD